MHPFHRLTRFIPPHESCSHHGKGKAVGNRDRDGYMDECGNSKKTSPFTIRSHRDEREHEGDSQVSLPLITISPSETEMGQANKINILKVKEMALWSNISPNWSGNGERLGPNKNRIIEESLKSGN